MKGLTIILIGLLSLASCTSLTKRTLNNIDKLEVKQKQEQVVEKKLSTSKAVYIDGALKALKKQPIEHTTPETKLALRLLENAQDIAGIPEHSLRLDVDLLTKPIADPVETTKLITLESEHRNAIREREVLEQEVNELRVKIEKDAKTLATIHDKSFITRIKEGIFNYIAVIAIIAMLIMFGPKLVSFILRFIKPL